MHKGIEVEPVMKFLIAKMDPIDKIRKQIIYPYIIQKVDRWRHGKYKRDETTSFFFKFS